ncbi:MAG: LysR family transcriptional regulator [Longibaculum muris]|uniref:DNA-binding transcriptional LysR family regulator n=1 Tax=Longibaculum muris TaxID=1796628 RepID=A0A4R3Z667_9FIRM|nr:LysR family transcriptional regulator [Longibaculum muris]KXU52337.1 transcriptional regulator, LysR family [Candidatus Stoquefichus sp. KLE1796]MBS5367939.1 LysR family transcriptional regulator [Coprobacillus cateniformis]MCR1887180.1 LysR family transcriptional regulator [Longibaculum muris]MED9811972.1 LysR family transcriptional regulator [Longibaculum muris]TCW02247.1 DNA-binding transcriptional LysR family regulator [Longibaculum muris]
MLLKQMKYFITIVDCHSFTEAAELCYISQSAISQQMKALENELGVELFKRNNRQFTLTLAGEYFYRHGKELIEEIENLKKETIRRGEDQELSLKIGYLRCYGAQELHHAIAQFSKTYPEVAISITNGTHEELYELLKSHDVDLVISDQRRAFNNDYFNYELLYSDCFIEISNLNPLSQKDKLTKEDLKRISCILVSTKQQESTEKDFYQNTLGFSNQFLFAQTLEEARLMVVSNRGFLPIEAVGTLPPPAPGISRIPLYHHDKQLQRNYCAFWEKAKTSYYIEEFAELLRQLLKEI